MNLTTAVFLMDETVRSVRVCYEPHEEKHQVKQRLFKTLDQDIKVGDFVIVPTTTRYNMTVCKVVGVDVEFNIEDENLRMEWIVGTVSRSEIDEIIAKEKFAIDKVQKVSLAEKRKNLREKMFGAEADSIAGAGLAQITLDSEPAEPPEMPPVSEADTF